MIPIVIGVIIGALLGWWVMTPPKKKHAGATWVNDSKIARQISNNSYEIAMGMLRAQEIKDKDIDIRLLMCKCHKCGCIRQCTLEFDFYGEVGDKLTCETCTVMEVLSKDKKD